MAQSSEQVDGSIAPVPWAFEERVVTELNEKGKFEEVKKHWETLLKGTGRAKNVRDLFQLYQTECGKLTLGRLRQLLKAIGCNDLLDQTFELSQRSQSGPIGEPQGWRKCPTRKSLAQDATTSSEMMRKAGTADEDSQPQNTDNGEAKSEKNNMSATPPQHMTVNQTRLDEQNVDFPSLPPPPTGKTALSSKTDQFLSNASVAQAAESDDPSMHALDSGVCSMVADLPANSSSDMNIPNDLNTAAELHGDPTNHASGDEESLPHGPLDVRPEVQVSSMTRLPTELSTESHQPVPMVTGRPNLHLHADYSECTLVRRVEELEMEKQALDNKMKCVIEVLREKMAVLQVLRGREEDLEYSVERACLREEDARRENENLRHSHQQMMNNLNSSLRDQEEQHRMLQEAQQRNQRLMEHLRQEEKEKVGIKKECNEANRRIETLSRQLLDSHRVIETFQEELNRMKVQLQVAVSKCFERAQLADGVVSAGILAAETDDVKNLRLQLEEERRQRREERDFFLVKMEQIGCQLNSNVLHVPCGSHTPEDEVDVCHEDMVYDRGHPREVDAEGVVSADQSPGTNEQGSSGFPFHEQQHPEANS